MAKKLVQNITAREKILLSGIQTLCVKQNYVIIQVLKDV